MRMIELSPVTLRKARDRVALTDEERRWVDECIGPGETSGVRPVRLDDAPKVFLRSLLQDSRISDRNRVAVTLAVSGMKLRPESASLVYGNVVESPVEFGAMLASVGVADPNLEFEWNERWYPAIAVVKYSGNEDKLGGPEYVTLQVTLDLGSHARILSVTVTESLFEDDEKRSIGLSVANTLHAVGLRPLQTPPKDFNVRLSNATRMRGETGRQVGVVGNVLAVEPGGWRSDFRPVALGSSERPRKAVVDGEFESGDRQYGARPDGVVSAFPVVRVFSLDLKAYVMVDVDDVREYVYDTDAMSRIELPSQILDVIKPVFSTPVDSLFGDVLDGKHGGVVILACGNPGVGKTLTSEIYAESCRRPLYTLELGELGTQASEVERNLRAIFSRVARWNAVLQFDECEIFLSERGDDLERSAIVGIFLRLLDYYEGILFLTSNRPEVIDRAVLSRVILRIDYPDLNAAARESIWRRMFRLAGLDLDDGDFEFLAGRELNGRQIRNATRLTKIVHPNGQVALSDVERLLSFGYSHSQNDD